LKALAAATEDEKKVLNALGIFVPMDCVKIIPANGHFGNEIKILEATLSKKLCMDFFHTLKKRLPSDDQLKLHREAPERIDEMGCFHFRLDKQAAYRGYIKLTNSKDAIDISVRIVSFPASWKESIRVVRELI